MQKRIQEFIPFDGKRTAFSAEVMNEFVAALNMLLNMEGKNGIQVTMSEGNVVISLDKNFEEETDDSNDGLPNTPITGSAGGDTYNYNCICRWS